MFSTAVRGGLGGRTVGDLPVPAPQRFGCPNCISHRDIARSETAVRLLRAGPGRGSRPPPVTPRGAATGSRASSRLRRLPSLPLANNPHIPPASHRFKGRASDRLLPGCAQRRPCYRRPARQRRPGATEAGRRSLSPPHRDSAFGSIDSLRGVDEIQLLGRLFGHLRPATAGSTGAVRRSITRGIPSAYRRPSPKGLGRFRLQLFGLLLIHTLDTCFA